MAPSSLAPSSLAGRDDHLAAGAARGAPIARDGAALQPLRRLPGRTSPARTPCTHAPLGEP
eukprot:7385842-Prymnesium_polylepis.1